VLQSGKANAACFRDRSFTLDDSRDIYSRLTTEQLRTVRELFDAAVEFAPDARAVFLNQASADPIVLEEVKQLLEAHSSTSQAWFECPMTAELSWDESGFGASLEGRQLGPYHVLRQLGFGGMGAVYLAERSIGKFRQRVALKIVRPGLSANADTVRRFEKEREILASLDHPNIARLRDIGSTPDGVPYLVMDYVEGEAIDVFCDSRQLGISDRLTIFRSACEAIDYAHSKGVIHRDLKPGNMLITADGTLKLLDFGIAKLLDSESQSKHDQTQTATRLMTIEYASPEQISGEAIGPGSDVYSLGVVLYELLTGCYPYRTESRVPHVIARAICDEEPVSPSNAVCDPTGPQGGKLTLTEIASLRAEKPHRLRRRIAGDLDSIILKALRKRPEWRYDSPVALSDDIGRHMAGLRVTARKDTLRYRAEKILHRLLYPSDGVFHTHGMLMLTAGILGMFLLGERQAVAWRMKAGADRILDGLAVAVWLCWSMREGRRMMRAGMFSALDRQAWILFTVITVALGLLTIVSVIRPLISPEAMAIFWNTGLSIGLVAIGLQANRLMTFAGIVLMISALLASFYEEFVYICLASGMLVGMVPAGLILVVQGDQLPRIFRNRTAGEAARDL
jgi:serine/threonine protein kinase